jgi:hypothetical protein
VSDLRPLIDTLERLDSVENAIRDLSSEDAPEYVTVRINDYNGRECPVCTAYKLPREAVIGGLKTMRAVLAVQKDDLSRACDARQMRREIEA